MGDGAFGFAFLREENVPAACASPNLGCDLGGFPAVPDLRMADEQVGDLHGSDDLAVVTCSGDLLTKARAWVFAVRGRLLIAVVSDF